MNEWILTDGPTKVQMGDSEPETSSHELELPQAQPHLGPSTMSHTSPRGPVSPTQAPGAHQASLQGISRKSTQRPPKGLHSFSFPVMSLFASPVIRAETLLLPLPNFPCSEKSCNPKVHIRGSGLERAAGWAGALTGEARWDGNTGTPWRTQSIQPAAS